MNGIIIKKRENKPEMEKPQQEKRKQGRPKTKMEIKEPEIISFDQVKKLNKLEIDPKMLDVMSCGNEVDKIFSYEGGLCKASNLMVGGLPGIGKTTLMLDCLAGIIKNNLGVEGSFISGEMGHRQMFKYRERFPHFGIIKTLFGHDYLMNNMKDVLEQFFDMGHDIILLDSIKVLLSKVRGDNNWDKDQAENWFVELCAKNNRGENKKGKYTSFIGIQFLNISNGEFAGGGKLQYLFDTTLKLLREKKSGETYIISDKNRDGVSGVPLYFELKDNDIIYHKLSEVIEEEGSED